MFGTGFSSHEKRLWKQEATALEAMGMSQREARKEAKRRVQQAISLSKAAGHYGEEPMGDFALQVYKTDPTRKQLWEVKKNEGVTDKDVLEWWNLLDVERQLMLYDDDSFRVAAWLERQDAGETIEQAWRSIWKAYPIFGVCTDAPVFPDDDTSVPLPQELKIRVMRWQEDVQRRGNVQEMKAESENFTTMNGYIRHLIRQGKI